MKDVDSPDFRKIMKWSKKKVKFFLINYALLNAFKIYYNCNL